MSYSEISLLSNYSSLSPSSIRRRNRSFDDDKNLLSTSPSRNSSIFVEGDMDTKPTFVFEEKERDESTQASSGNVEAPTDKDETTKF